MAGHAARHGARKRTPAAASLFESFAVAAGALSVVALMTFIAGGPGSVDGRVTGDRSVPTVSSGAPSTAVGSTTTHGPSTPAGRASPSPADVSGVLPTGSPVVPTEGSGPAVPAGAAAPTSGPNAGPGSGASLATPTVRPTKPVTPTPSTKPSTPAKPPKSPRPVPSSRPSLPVTPPVTPGIPPTTGSRPGPTP